MNQLMTSNGSQILTMIDSHPKLGDNTKYKYRLAIQSALEQGVNLLSASELTDYAATLSVSRQRHLKSALKVYLKRLEFEAKSQATPENISSIQAALLRFEALDQTIELPDSKGKKIGFWLTKAQVVTLMNNIDRSTVRGRRDWLLMAILFGSGLRRDELSRLTFADITERPNGSGTRCLISVEGKGRKQRTIPVSKELCAAIADWSNEVGSDGHVLKTVKRSGEIVDGLSAVSIFNTVRKIGAQNGFDDLAPHDCRRTFADIAYKSGILLTEISRLLGHSSVEVTERYLDLEVDLDHTASDFISLS